VGDPPVRSQRRNNVDKTEGFCGSGRNILAEVATFGNGNPRIARIRRREERRADRENQCKATSEKTSNIELSTEGSNRCPPRNPVAVR
jgi:hypothetical protein